MLTDRACVLRSIVSKLKHGEGICEDRLPADGRKQGLEYDEGKANPKHTYGTKRNGAKTTVATEDGPGREGGGVQDREVLLSLQRNRRQRKNIEWDADRRIDRRTNKPTDKERRWHNRRGERDRQTDREWWGFMTAKQTQEQQRLKRSTFGTVQGFLCSHLPYTIVANVWASSCHFTAEWLFASFGFLLTLWPRLNPAIELVSHDGFLVVPCPRVLLSADRVALSTFS